MFTAENGRFVQIFSATSPHSGQSLLAASICDNLIGGVLLRGRICLSSWAIVIRRQFMFQEAFLGRPMQIPRSSNGGMYTQAQ